MKLTKTTLKELTKKYRAVLIKCAMLNAIACVLLYSNNALADDIVISNTGVSPDIYGGGNVGTDDVRSFKGVYSTKEDYNIGSNVNSIKTNEVVKGDVTGIGLKTIDGVITSVLADSILDGIDIQSYGYAYGVDLNGISASKIYKLGNIEVKSKRLSGDPNPHMAVGINVSSAADNRIQFKSADSFILAESETGAAYGIGIYGTSTSGKLTVENLGHIEAKTSASDKIASGIYGEGTLAERSLTVSFNGTGGEAIKAEAINPSNAYSIYNKGQGTTTVNFKNSKLSGKILNEAILNLNFENGSTWNFKNEDIQGAVTKVTLNGGSLDLRDGNISAVSSIAELNLYESGGKKSTSLLYVDVDLAADTPSMDTLSTLISGSGELHIAGLNLISEALFDETSVTFTTDDTLINATQYTGPSSYNLGGFTYTVLYDKTTGQFTFLKQELLQNDIEEEIVKGVFSGVNNALNSTNTAVNTSLRGRFANLGNSSTPSSNNSNVKKGQSGGDEDSKLGLWAQAIYSKVDREKSSASVGFKGHSEGVLIGADTEVTDNVIAGLAYAYTKSNMKSSGSKTNIDTHAFYAYGQYKEDDKFVNGSIGYGFSKADPKDSDKDIKSNFYSLDALAGYNQTTNLGMITPALGLRYIRIEQKSYNDGDTKVKAKDANTLTAVAQIGWSDMYKVSGKEIKPKASLGFIYDLKSDNNKVVISSAGAKTLAEDGRLKRFGTELSFGADAKITNNWNVSLDYTGEFRQHYENHTGTLSVRYDF
ncbi:MAG: autotransporter outer membrane beta-barrel domain-containing protein [Alphaproteobacteria bacterium]|nr:autotransporter outer membrane beta-barrel domain-containing protein [Alphaproteobacteria bacterium]